MKVYNGTFLKKNGEERKMTFVKISDLPTQFMEGKVKGKRKPVTLAEGLELVWDVDKSEFRIFNWNTVKGEIYEEIVEEDSKLLA
jgi:HJR/Mrr/RecB family endonuclease